MIAIIYFKGVFELIYIKFILAYLLLLALARVFVIVYDDRLVNYFGLIFTNSRLSKHQFNHVLFSIIERTYT